MKGSRNLSAEDPVAGTQTPMEVRQAEMLSGYNQQPATEPEFYFVPGCSYIILFVQSEWNVSSCECPLFTRGNDQVLHHIAAKSGLWVRESILEQ